MSPSTGSGQAQVEWGVESGGPPTRPIRVVLSETKDLRLPAPPSPKAKGHSLPIAQDPSLPVIDQDDTTPR
jgi:hypothetical protein